MNIGIGTNTVLYGGNTFFNSVQVKAGKPLLIVFVHVLFSVDSLEVFNAI